MRRAELNEGVDEEEAGGGADAELGRDEVELGLRGLVERRRWQGGGDLLGTADGAAARPDRR